MLKIDPTDAVPIFRQIDDEIRRLIAVGSLPPGGAIPSVRDLARELRVNPATVAKAYQKLTDAGVLTVKRGEGTFVADTMPTSRKSERREAIRAAAEKYAGTAMTIGASLEEATDEVDTAWSRIGGRDERSKR
ncbi:MAG: GntR family transcriptional regulator [Thermoanaerobaculia bacterium]